MPLPRPLSSWRKTPSFIDGTVFEARMTVVRTGALGMIETRGLLGAIEAADAALKSASVSLIGTRKAGGGLVTVLLSGDVAAVRSAVDAASASLSRLGIGFSAHVIPRLDPEAWRFVDLNVGPEAWRLVDLNVGPALPQEPGGAVSVPCREDAVGPEPFRNGEDEKDEVAEPGGEGLDGTSAAVPLALSLRDGLRRMTVAELRRLAREVSLDTLTRRQIRDANKRELVARLGMFFERSGEENRALAWEKVGKLLQKNGVMRRDAD